MFSMSVTKCSSWLKSFMMKRRKYFPPIRYSGGHSSLPLCSHGCRFTRNHCACAQMLYISELCEDSIVANEIDYAWTSKPWQRTRGQGELRHTPTAYGHRYWLTCLLTAYSLPLSVYLSPSFEVQINRNKILINLNLINFDLSISMRPNFNLISFNLINFDLLILMCPKFNLISYNLIHFNSYRAGWFLKCSFLLKSEVYPIFLLLYLSSTAWTLIGVNRKVVRKFIFYPHITKWLNFALKFLILIRFSSALFLQLERIRNTIHLYGQMHIFINNVRINAKFTPKNCM